MPQFIPHHANVSGYALAFAATDALIAGAWLATVAWLSDRARALLHWPRVRPPRLAAVTAVGTATVSGLQAAGTAAVGAGLWSASPGRPRQGRTCALALPQRCALLVAGEDDVAARVAADEAPYPAIDWTDPGGLWASIAG